MTAVDWETFAKSLRNETHKIDSKIFRDIITTCRKMNVHSHCQPDDDRFILFLDTSLPLFLMHLQTTFDNLDDQLVCSTSYCTLLSMKSEKTLYIKHMEVALSSYNTVKSAPKNNLDDNFTKYSISLIYGLFQSNNFLSYISNQDEICVSNIIELSFSILSIMCYEYSHFTFVSFKLLHLLLTKTVKSKFNILVNNEKLLKLLTITSQNWENPITGIREQNRFLFGLFLDISQLENISNHVHYDELINNISEFPWNKSKYLILAEVISKDSRSIAEMLDKESWLDGLMQSLKITTLVSAGTDMYFSVLKKINNENVWLEIFEQKVFEILQTGDFLEVVNFNNYWLLNTLKKFPHLIQSLIQKITAAKNIYGSKTLYIQLSLVKCGIKIAAAGLSVLKGHNTLLTCCDLIKGLHNENIAIRCQAFEIICTLQKPDTFEIQSELFLDFVQDNCNTDSTPLRQSMINSVVTFLIYIRNIGLKTDANSNISHFNKLFIKLQEFLILNLEFEGNYQRTITSLKLIELILRYFSIHNVSIEDKKKGLYRKSNVKGDAASLKALQGSLSWRLDEDHFVLLIFDHLKNPTSDIRETAYKILVSNYGNHSVFLNTHKLTFQNILKNCNSKLFYDIESGTTMMKLFCNMNPANVNIDLYNTILKEVTEQFEAQKKDILSAIHNEKPLHGILTAFIIFFSTVTENKNTNFANSESLEHILILIQKISKYYLLALFDKSDVEIDLSNHPYPPSFSEMGESIEHIVLTSSFQIGKSNDKEKLSDLHQLVLNCIWLNLKACCDLAQCIISCISHDNNMKTVESYINVILSVLKQCRHKGAIEAAGVALGKATKHLTSMPKLNSLSAVPMRVLKEFLCEVTLENSAGGSVTRRSAGLAIMMHRLVINDMQYGKPMFHHTMKTLLNTAKESGSDDRMGDPTLTLNDVSNERDISKAKILHLLCRIVSDSSLASDVMNYASDLADICFGNLTSDQWQIRNAALQLYGALVPKLIGQKKSQGNDEDSAATVCCDELFTHVPTLWTYINRELTSKDESDQALLTHSNLVPILSLLAGTAKRYYFRTRSSDRNLNFKPLFRSLIHLLSSPIYTVRRLTAKSLEIIFEFSDFYKYFKNIQINLKQNSLHGHLMLVLNYKNRLKNSSNEDIKRQLSFVIQKLNEMGQFADTTFLVKASYLEINTDILKYENCIEDTKRTLNILNSNKSKVGIGLWANAKLKNLSVQCVETDIPELLTMFLAEIDGEQYCTYMKDRIMNDDKISGRNLQLIVDLLMKNDFTEKQFVLKFAFDLIERHSNKFSIGNPEYFNLLTSYLYKEDSIMHTSYLIPLIVTMYVQIKTNVNAEIEEADIIKTSQVIRAFTDPERCDVSKRLLSAVSVNAFGECIKCPNVSLPVKVNVLTSCVYLLQDEEEDIRKEMGKMCQICDLNTAKDSFYLQSNVCLKKLLNVDFLYEVFASVDLVNKFVEHLERDVKVKRVKKTKVDRYNPFETDTNNIYWEPEALLQLLKKIININVK